MKITFYGKYAIVEYFDGTYYNGQFDLINKQRNGIGAMYDGDNNLLRCGDWCDDMLITEMSGEKYNEVRKDW